jgi:Cu/Ag efflux protein CusF
MHMIRTALLCLACACLQACSFMQQEPPKPQQGMAHVTTVTSTVTEIDYVTRRVTLTDKDGQPLTVTVGNDVRNLDQVRVGDEVVAEYVDAVAVLVEKPAHGAGITASYSMDRAEPGEKPSAIAVTTQEIRATVMSIDYDNRRVTVKGPQGNVKTLGVDSSVSNFRHVKVGDEVVVRHTHALAIAVRKP